MPKRPKCKQAKAQHAKIKGNQGPKGQNEARQGPKSLYEWICVSRRAPDGSEQKPLG